MGRSSKSRRFVKQGADSVMLHDQKFPYHMTYAEAEEQRERKQETATQTSLGGF
ncbi:hypothetical protein [Metabacillus lacus]|uniref:hypothetical protein n=1 Tax=Metabacillus lacus TaxID=1983721 RepID=UPI001BA9946E|nr:hypothetical protein [Metabacillus lacus]